MRAVYTEDELIPNVNSARREAEAAFGNGQIYLEKLVVQPRHVEVQILGDKYGNFCTYLSGIAPYKEDIRKS